jgi:UDP-glucose 4-epimerase
MSGRAFLLTGATTALGRAVARRLEHVGRVVGVRAPHEPAAGEAPALNHVANLTRAADVRKLVLGLAAEHEVDTIVHLGCTAPGAPVDAGSSDESTRLLLDAAERVATMRGFVLRSSALIYRASHSDALVMDERHPLDFSCRSLAQRKRLEADVTASQRIPAASLRISVLRLSEVLAPGVFGSFADYVQLDPCCRPMGFDPMINVLSIDDAAQALARAAELHPRGLFNVPGADTLPVSELMHRLGRSCWPMPDSAIEPLYTLRGIEPSTYATLRPLLHHGSVVDGHAAQAAFGYRPSHPIAFERLFVH